MMTKNKGKALLTLLAGATGFGLLAGTVPTGYVTEGLTACWDAIDNQGTGTHDATARSWVDLVGGHAFALSGVTWGEQCVQFTGKAGSCGWLRDSIGGLALFNYTADSTDRTVEIVYKSESTASGIILHATTRSGIAVGRNGTSNLILSNASQPASTPAPTKDAFSTITAAYRAGAVVTASTFRDGAAATFSGYDCWSGSNNRQVSLGGRTGFANTLFCGKVYAIRVYNRLLTAEEVTQNYTADVSRFSLSTAATVVSGSVTVGETTYGAGEAIRVDAASTDLAIASATDATLTLADRTTALTLEAGTLAFAEGHVGEMTYLDALTLGATATLTLPADGLSVTGTLTAETGATVAGPGILAAAQETAPVTLAESATYLSLASSFAWPSSGIAYIPAETNIVIAAEDLAQVEALDKIVFLSPSSKVTYKLADAWTFDVPVEGPGTFAVESAGKFTLAGDNKNLTGAFFFSNTTVLVTHEHGLGSTRAQTCHFWGGDQTETISMVNYGHPIDFDNGQSVFTNRVAIHMHPLQDLRIRFGSVSVDKTLVQDADFIHSNGSGSPTAAGLAFWNNVKFLKHYEVETSYTPYPKWYFTANGGAWLLGTLRISTTGILYVNGGDNLHMGLKSVDVNPYALIYTTHFVCERENALFPVLRPYSSDYAGYCDLNGYDQAFEDLSTGTGGNNVLSGNPLFFFTSAKPAAMRQVGAKSKNINPQFTGAAGFTMAGSGTFGFYNQSGDVKNTTTGELRVDSGTLLLTDNYTWPGTNVTVTGGALQLSGTKGVVSGDNVHLKVTGGTIALKDGASMLVGYATFGTTNLLDDTYTMAQLQALPEVAPYIGADADPTATLTVQQPDDREWHGWPDEPTDVLVPGNMTIYVGADETNKVAKALSIDLGVKARIVCTNMPGAAIVLAMPISGKGTFEFENCGTVTLSGDNSGLVAPGAFTFTKTSVIVDHRYGLGSSKTGACYHYCDLGWSAPGNLFRFTANAKTNDVSCFVDNALYLGGTDETVSFVQNGSFTQSGASWTTRPTWLGGTEFNAGFTLNALSGPATTLLHITSNATLSATGNQIGFYGSSTLYIDTPVPSSQLNVLVLQYGYTVHLNADYAFDLKWRDGTPPSGGLQSHNYGTIYLHGHDQRVAHIYGGNTKYPTDNEPLVFTSDEPATLYFAQVDYSSRPGQDRCNGKAFAVQGAITIDYTGPSTMTQQMCWAHNDTTGSLLINSGAFQIGGNGYWGGTNITITSGTLVVDASARAAATGGFFGRKTGLAMTTSGKLNLAADRVDAVRTFKLGDDYLAAGYYGGADSPDTYEGKTVTKLDVLTGAGLLKVRLSAPNPGLIYTVR